MELTFEGIVQSTPGVGPNFTLEEMRMLIGQSFPLMRNHADENEIGEATLFVKGEALWVKCVTSDVFTIVDIASGKLRGLSLDTVVRQDNQGRVESIQPKAVTVCESPAREGCFISD
jgi:hypothetical protein